MGLAAIQLARAAGMTVLATAGTEAGVKLVAKQGAHHTFNHRAEGYMDKVCGSRVGVSFFSSFFPFLFSLCLSRSHPAPLTPLPPPQIKAATGGKGVDVIVEMLANVNLGADLPLLAHGGVVAIVGSRGNVEINPRDLMLREASVIGVLGETPIHRARAARAGLQQSDACPLYCAQVARRRSVKRHSRPLMPVRRRNELKMPSDACAHFNNSPLPLSFVPGLASGALKPVVGVRFPLEQAGDAHVEVLEHKQGTSGKIVLTME